MNQLPLGSLSALQAKLTYLVNSILQTPQDLLEYISHNTRADFPAPAIPQRHKYLRIGLEKVV